MLLLSSESAARRDACKEETKNVSNYADGNDEAKYIVEKYCSVVSSAAAIKKYWSVALLHITCM